MLDEEKKNAYRWLLHMGMLEIRMQGWRMHRCFGWRMLNPFNWRRVRSHAQIATDVADALHNLGWFAAEDFRRFDDDLFWEDMERLKRAHPDSVDYRALFEGRLEELREGRKP
jgi:hypothetical protein